MQGLSPDVAGATFMAAGSSSPELFVAGLAVFVTHDPVGVGAATGSTMFNFCTIIGGAAVITTDQELGVKLEWRVILRDGGVYALSLFFLMLVLQDGQVSALESILMLVLYAGYILLCAKFSTVVKSLCPMNLKSIAHVIAKNKTISKALQNTSSDSEIDLGLDLYSTVGTCRMRAAESRGQTCCARAVVLLRAGAGLCRCAREQDDARIAAGRRQPRPRRRARAWLLEGVRSVRARPPLLGCCWAELWFGCVRSDCGCCHASISFCPKVPDPAKQIARTPSTLRPLPPEC